MRKDSKNKKIGGATVSKKSYATNPYWHLLGKALESPPDYRGKAQGEFSLAIERLSGSKIPIRNREDILRVFEEVWQTLKNSRAVQANYNAEILASIQRFIGGDPLTTREGGFAGEDRYRPVPKVEQFRKKTLLACQQLRDALLKSYTPQQTVKIMRQLGLPKDAADFLFRYYVTGVRTLGRMNISTVGIEQGRPRLLLTAHATRNDLDGFIPTLKRNRKYFPKGATPPRPYLHRYAGIDYVAVDLYRNRLSEIRKFMARIDRLQAKLPGHSWKQKKQKPTLARNLEARKGRESGKPSSYGKIAVNLSERYSPNPDEALSEGTLRTAVYRLKRSTR